MRKLLSKASIVRLNVFGWYQIAGGAFGILLTIKLLAGEESINGLLLLLYLFAFILYGYSVYCGVLLLGKKYKLGLMLSLINQALQVFSFIFIGYAFMYVAGSMILASISYSSGEPSSGVKLGLKFVLTPAWRLFFNSDDRSFDISVNLLAMILTYFTYKLHQRVKNDIIPDNEPQYTVQTEAE